MKIAGVTNKAVSLVLERQVGHWLSAEELTHCGSLPASKAANWLAGRIALKQAWLDHISPNGTGPTTFAIANNLMGIPYVDGLSGAFCSISHYGGWGVGVVSDQPIGVDMERRGTRQESILHYISTAEETDKLAGDERDAETLLAKIWTLKESAIKAWRGGLNPHPKQVKLIREDCGTFTVRATPATHRTCELRAFVYAFGDFVIAVSLAEAVPARPEIHWVDASRLAA